MVERLSEEQQVVGSNPTDATNQYIFIGFTNFADPENYIVCTLREVIEMRKLMFKALLPVTIDLPEFWQSIPDHTDTDLGGENGKYTVVFKGDVVHGLEVLEIILKTMDDYSITLQTFQEVENVKAEKVETEGGKTPSDSV